MNQLSFLPEPPFFPILPSPNSNAMKALTDLCQGPITQIDWLREGKSWRLGGAIKELDYLGWEPVSVQVQTAEWKNPIARYSLTERAKQAAFSLRQKGGKHASE